MKSSVRAVKESAESKTTKSDLTSTLRCERNFTTTQRRMKKKREPLKAPEILIWRKHAPKSRRIRRGETREGNSGCHLFKERSASREFVCVSAAITRAGLHVALTS